MKKNTTNNIRLGIFIIAGLLILVVSLYMIGENQNFFGSNFLVKARFRDVNGLMPGNNVRFSGIQCGTVKDIEIINDTTIEVRMLISEKTSPYIRSNARAAIGTEGLMGNKVINIFPGTGNAAVISDGNMLYTDMGKGIDDMFGTLSTTADNAKAISESLNAIADRINNSRVLNELLNDTTIPGNLHQTMKNLKNASTEIQDAAIDINWIVKGIKNGKGAAGILLADPKTATTISATIEHIHSAAGQADRLITDLDSMTGSVLTNFYQGNGVAGLLLKDTVVVKRVQNSLENIEKGTEAFKEDMNALKHNFLLRGYFKKQERKKVQE